ncbi:BTAD domain-containing putative transcriptional regulator [Streptomyces sp. NPDC048254]|uniref:BTAD domain-containing putative transcriptional regulator n=1 Tax=Streptomyces sp. NPDC048254 TaxID=3365525 RepID=UPI00371970EC
MKKICAGSVDIVVELHLLGPVELSVQGRTVEVGPPQRRTVLAALAVDAGRPVPADVLIRRVWGADPPDGARRALHAHVARLRRLCERTEDPGHPRLRLVRRSAGYLLEARPDQVDIHRFRQLVGRARETERSDETRAALLREALGLWHGEPLAGLGGQWAAQVREAWRRQHVDASVAWARVKSRVSDPVAVIGPLTELLDAYPLVEPLTEALMRALHAAGRSAEALDCYSTVRKRLTEELGTDPGAELRKVHQAILRGGLAESVARPVSRTPVRAAPPARRPAVTTPWPGPAPGQLPMGVRGFTGRGEELARLEDILAASAEQPSAVVITAVSGTAGVGKTALAVHWARRAQQAFPDGQLYVNLHGFAPGGSATSPAEAVRGFLDALEVPPARIPAGLEAQVGLYRSLLAGRRVLVVLDNARDAEQVRPLLPGAPGCLALITSRRSLTGLAATEGAQLLTVGMLAPDGEVGSHAGQARIHQHLSRMSEAQGRHQEALGHAQDSLSHHRAAGDRAGQSAALNHIGWILAQRGDHEEALTHCRQALDLALETGDLNGQANIQDSLGYLHHGLGEHAEAVDRYQQALDLFHQTGDRHSEASGLLCLGDIHDVTGRPYPARAAWAQALAITAELGLPDTDPLRARLLERHRRATADATTAESRPAPA